MGRLRRVTQFSAIAFAFAAACSLGVNEDDYVGGTKTDAGGGIDGTTDDGGSSCTFPGKTFCATVEGGSAAGYCNDFDEARPSSDRIIITDGGGLTLDCVSSKSSPNALRSTTSARDPDGGVGGRHYVIVNDVTVDEYLRLSFDMLVETLAVGDTAVGEMRFEKSGKVERILRVLIGKDETNASRVKMDNFFIDGGVLDRVTGAGEAIELTPGWRHIDLEIDLGTGVNRARVCVDGVKRDARENNGLGLTSSAQVFVGLDTVSATAPQAVRIDNMVVTKVRDPIVDGGPLCCTCGRQGLN